MSWFEAVYGVLAEKEDMNWCSPCRGWNTLHLQTLVTLAAETDKEHVGFTMYALPSTHMSKMTSRGFSAQFAYRDPELRNAITSPVCTVKTRRRPPVARRPLLSVMSSRLRHAVHVKMALGLFWHPIGVAVFLPPRLARLLPPRNFFSWLQSKAKHAQKLLLRHHPEHWLASRAAWRRTKLARLPPLERVPLRHLMTRTRQRKPRPMRYRHTTSRDPDEWQD